MTCQNNARTSSLATLSLPESSAVTAVVGRCCRQRWKETCHRQAIADFTILLLPSILRLASIYSFSHSAHLSHSFFPPSLCLSFCSFLPFFYFIRLSHLLLLSCVPVITGLSTRSTNNACVVPPSLLVLPIEYTMVCLFVYLFQYSPSGQALRWDHLTGNYIWFSSFLCVFVFTSASGYQAFFQAWLWNRNEKPGNFCFGTSNLAVKGACWDLRKYNSSDNLRQGELKQSNKHCAGLLSYCMPLPHLTLAVQHTWSYSPLCLPVAEW